MNELQQQLNVETIAATPAFEQLLELTIDTCLSDREVFGAHLQALKNMNQADATQEIVRRIGLWGVRQALEDSLGELGASRDVSGAVDAQQESEALFTHPEPSIQHKIEALGLAILDEAFDCLGEDAEQKVEEYKAARTRKERLTVFNWLGKRLREIHEVLSKDSEEVTDNESVDEEQVDETAEQGDEPFYHPARLSPKLIGRFPDTKVDPTCLGMSILAASFFQKTGESFLHAGVMRTSNAEARTIEAAIIQVFEDYAEECGIPIPDDIRENLDEIKRYHKAVIEYRDSFHATVLAPFFDGNWAQTDPNFRNNIVIPQQGSNQITKVHSALLDLKMSAGGTETMVLNRNSLGTYYFFDRMIELTKTSKPLEEYDGFLQDVPEDTALSEILSEVFPDIIDPKLRTTDEMKGQLRHLFESIYGLDYNQQLQEILESVIEDYVFEDAKDKGLAWCIRKCKTDANYGLRRAEDLKYAPFYGLIRLFNHLQHAIIKDYDKRPHSLYEVGLAPYRVGACVLSDFASYCGDDLPPSFWLTYWPSHISLVEHSEKKDDSPAQRQIVEQIARLINRRRWTYPHIHDIIDDILEQEEKDGDKDARRRTSEGDS
jgi:hypothetical protein